VELDSAHALAVQNVFGGHRLVAVQKARIAALKAAGLARGHERLLEIMERRQRLLEEDERKLRPARRRVGETVISTSYHV
jgi:hypothetical protein